MAAHLAPGQPAQRGFIPGDRIVHHSALLFEYAASTATPNEATGRPSFSPAAPAVSAARNPKVVPATVLDIPTPPDPCAVTPDEGELRTASGRRGHGGMPMATHEIRIDPSCPLGAQPGTGHNRWHPDIPPVVRCRPGDEVVLETRDALDGQLTRDATRDDVAKLDLGLIHPLTGPVYVEGAEPGDVLVAEILEVVPDSFGWTAEIPGFGFLRDDFPEPYIVKWDIDDGWATSDDLPGIRLPGAPFMGVIGLAPSRELMAQITAREADLIGRGGFALPPDPAGAIPTDSAIAGEALRTIPPRENAGNVDIKQLCAGTRLLMPVWTEGAVLSVGDAHFAQGDCETCGPAVEMRSTLRVRFDVRTGEAVERDR